jgi:hypothetical protein
VNGGRLPTTLDYVSSYLKMMRAETKKRTMFTRAGRTVVRSPGERIIFSPTGEKIRVTEIPGPEYSGGNQVEHGDHLHAHVRPLVVTAGLGGMNAAVQEAVQERQARQRGRLRSYFYGGSQARHNQPGTATGSRE